MASASPRNYTTYVAEARTMAKPPQRAFAQILGKFYFFELDENLRRILLDYAQKRSCIANAAFNAPC
jgi:hypothetical protein